MARGNASIVCADPKGQFEEMIVKTGQTLKAGMCVEKDPSVALKSGVWTCRIFAQGVDGEMPGGSLWIVTNLLQAMAGGDVTTSIAAGERVLCYSPRKGEEINLLLKNIAGTGDDHAVGEKLIVDTGTGLFIATTGTPEQEVAKVLEAVTDPTADTLCWCEWGG